MQSQIKSAAKAKIKLEPKKSLRAKHAAQILGVGESTFWRYTQKIPGFPAGRKLSPGCTIFDEEELLAWRDSQPKNR